MPRQTTVNISLTPELGAFVKAKVDSGQYQSASELVREGLRALVREDDDREAQLQGIRQKIEIGWQQSERGEGRDGEKVIRELLAKLKKKRMKKRVRG